MHMGSGRRTRLAPEYFSRQVSLLQIRIASGQVLCGTACIWLPAWTGANSFAELSSSIPLDGSAQACLPYAYGPGVSYLFSWTISALKKIRFTMSLTPPFTCFRNSIHNYWPVID
ncbi:hypothetical protein OG21DRAFT_534331 [Imleria badia]|nr:hypothetical protein OG21DRAFT_534331 [Imleria badia]